MFQLHGTVSKNTAVAGALRFGDGKADRPVLIILSEGLTDYKRRKKIQLSKSEAKESITPIAGEESSSLIGIFSSQAEDDITGRIETPYEAQPTVDLILEETETGLVILDCANRHSFWAALDSLGVSKNDLFSLAELNTLKPKSTKTDKAKKPIVKAHELCRSLAIPADFFGHAAKFYLDKVRSAVKVKAPEFRFDRQVILASFNRDLALSKGELNLHGFDVLSAIKAKLVNAWRRLLNQPEFIFTELSVPDEIALKMLEMQLGALPQHKHSRILQESCKLFNPLITTSPNPEEVLREAYTSYYGINDIDEILDNTEPQIIAAGIQHSRVLFRDGIYTMPYDSMVICQENYSQLDNGTKSEDSDPYNYYVLLESEQDGTVINANIFCDVYDEDGYLRHLLHCEEFKIHLNDDGSIEHIHSYDRRNNIEENLKFFGMSPLAISLGQALSTLARMNEPGFSEHVVKPIRGVKSTFKGEFPFFEAIDVSDFGPANGYSTINPDGSIEGVSLHKVRKHPRRIFDKETGALKKVVSVKAHTRGSASVGVKVSSFDYS